MGEECPDWGAVPPNKAAAGEGDGLVFCSFLSALESRGVPTLWADDGLGVEETPSEVAEEPTGGVLFC